MGPPIHYYGDMTMEDNKDKIKEDELTKMLDSIIDEVFKGLDISEDEEEKDKEEE